MVLSFIASCSRISDDVNMAKSVKITGRVAYLTRAGAKPKILKTGVRILPEYQIITVNKSECAVQLGSGVIINIAENTTAVFSDLIKNSDGEKTKLKMTRGKVLVTVSKLKQNSDSFQIMTPTIVAGVRGTAFAVDCTDPQNTVVAVSKGKVAVREKIAALDDEQSKNISLVMRQALEKKVEQNVQVVEVNKEVVINTAQAQKIDTAITAAAVKEDKKIKEIIKQYEEKKETAADKETVLEEMKTALQKNIQQTFTVVDKEITEAAAVREKPRDIAPERKTAIETVQAIAPVPIQELQKMKTDAKPAPVKEEQKKEPSVKEEPVDFSSQEAEEKSLPEAPDSDAAPAAAVKEKYQAETPVQTSKKKETVKAPAQKPAAAEPKPAAEPPIAAARVAEGILELSLPAGVSEAKILDKDGTARTVKPGKNNLAPGVYMITISKEGYRPYKSEFTVEDGKTARHSAVLKKRVVVSERVTLLDNTVIAGHVVNQTDDMIEIDTDDGLRKIDRVEIQNIEILNKK